MWREDEGQQLSDYSDCRFGACFYPGRRNVRDVWHECSELHGYRRKMYWEEWQQQDPCLLEQNQGARPWQHHHLQQQQRPSGSQADNQSVDQGNHVIVSLVLCNMAGICHT
jgi:hypothetical protein